MPRFFPLINPPPRPLQCGYRDEARLDLFYAAFRRYGLLADDLYTTC